MGKGTEGLQNMLGRIHARYEEVAFAVPVWCLVNPRKVRERRQMGGISASSMVFNVNVNNVVHWMVKEGIKAVGV